jgi:hypothetical protein
MPSAAEKRQQQALRDRLPDQPRPAGAERRAHRELAAPCRAAGDEQVRDVHRRDPEHEHDGSEHRDERGLDALRHLGLQGRHDQPAGERSPRRLRVIRDRAARDLRLTATRPQVLSFICLATSGADVGQESSIPQLIPRIVRREAARSL